jgi:TonB-linked SusC/RagA family outer membrane protein
MTCFLTINSYSQSSRVSLDLKNVTVKEVLDEIEKTSEFYFLYSSRLIDVDHKVNIHAENKPVKDILDKLFSGTDVDYVVIDQQIILSPKDYLAEAKTKLQTNTITGTVTNEKGEPLPGLSIIIKGTTRGTVTNLNGEYAIEVDDPSTVLVFSYVGYITQERTVGNQTVININTKVDILGLEEVVVIGYGTQRKINLTGSISTMNFDEDMSNRPITNASQALGGKVTGVWASQNSGKPGDDGAQLRIRGWGTMNNPDPFILIDGVEGLISDLNPNDIESITVLKDAASSAIYGSRAANGVLLITTKSGKFSEETHVHLNSYLGFQSLGRRYDLIDNSVEFMNIWNQALINQGGDALFPEKVINDFRNNDDPYRYPNTNFFDYVFETAPITDHNLSFSGGSGNSNYYASINYLDQEGIMLRTNSERYGLTMNLESRVNDWLIVGARFSGSRKESTEPASIWEVMYWFANGAYPFIAPYTRDGRFGAVQALNPATGNPIVDNRNPLILNAIGRTLFTNNYAKINTYADIYLTDYLVFKTNFATQYNNNLADRYNQSISGYTDTGIEAIGPGKIQTLYAERSINETYYYQWFNTLNFSKSFDQRHSLSAIAGMQVENSLLKYTYGFKTDLPKAGLTQVSAGTANIQAEGTMSVLRMLSYFGRLNYSLSDKYLFEMNLRADASSRFKRGYRWGIFPAFSAGWRLSEEEFIKRLNIFSNLKLRCSWGSLGNQNITGYWPFLTVITQSNLISYSYGGKLAPGAATVSLVDESISWETTTSADMGIDLGFFRNRLSAEFDYFDRTTKDIIVQLPIPHVLGGLNAPYENVGEMTNKGFEVVINYTETAHRDFLGYHLNANMTYVDNEVTRFRKDSPDQLYLIREGYSYRCLYGYKAVGVYQTDQEALEHMYANGYVPHAGDLKYQDVNKDGKIGYEDKMVCGNTIPKYTLGFTLGFTYKGFDLDILAIGVTGINVYTQDAWTQPLGVSGATITKRWRDAWSPENSDTDVPSIKINDPWNGEAYESTFWMHDISYVKFKNLQLGYAFPGNITAPLGLQRLYVYANAQNIGSLVNREYEGFDPERNTFDTGEFTYPAPRIISFGINVSF